LCSTKVRAESACIIGLLVIQSQMFVSRCWSLSTFYSTLHLSFHFS